MSNPKPNTLRNWMIAGAAAITLSVLGSASPALAQAKEKDKSKETAPAATKDELIFKNGNKVEGTITKETETTITMIVRLGGMSAETTYDKSEILKVTRGIAADAPSPTSPSTKPGQKDGKKDGKKDETPRETGGPKVYILKMTGEFGRDVSNTPFDDVIDDIKKHQPDVLVLEFDHTFSLHGEEMPDFVPATDMYGQVVTAKELATKITERIPSDPDFKVKPRVVSWIKKAMGGSAFLPFISREIYYTSDAHHGGIGGLDHKFDGRGDERTREKQYSLLLAWAQSMCEFGGHDKRIMSAMSRVDFVLSFRMEGGKPVYLERMPEGADEFLLTDDGLEERADQVRDIIRFKSNDVLTLDAVTAQRLGVSRGTADSEHELMDKLGLPRDFEIVSAKAGQIFKEWGTAVAKAETDIRRLLREYQEVQVRQPGQYRERTAARGERKRLLQQLKGVVDRYGEAINPARFGSAQGILLEIDRLIYQIEQQQRLDKPE